MLRHKATRKTIAERIEADLSAFLKALNYNNFIGHYVARKVVVGAARYLKDVAENDQHALRLRFDRFVREFIVRLKTDPEFRVKGEA